MKQNKQRGPAEVEAPGPPRALSLAECLCPICQELLAEPVTPPCGHSLCRGCFQQTVEISNLNCPLCRRRLSNWVRAQARRGGLVDTELEQRIRQQFAGVRGKESAEVNRLCPPPQLCKPGELRQEYEEQINKLKAERYAREEEEHRASEDFIQKLLAEEQEQQMYAEQKRKEMDEQLKRDEKLAKILSEEVNSTYKTAPESFGGRTKSIFSKCNSSISKGTKLTAYKPNNMEDIQRLNIYRSVVPRTEQVNSRYLSPTLPKYQTAEISRLRSNASGPEKSTSEADELISSSSSISIRLFHCDEEEEPVSSSNQSELVQFIEGTPNEAIKKGQMGECTSEHSPKHNESEMSGACSSTQNGSKKAKEDVPLTKLKMNSIDCNEVLLDSTIVPILSHELEHACTSTGCGSKNIGYAPVQNLIQGEAAEHEMLSQSPFKMTTVVKRKACNSSEVSTPSCVTVKKRKMCHNDHDKPSENTQCFHDIFYQEHLVDWERQLFEKRKMEEQDRLLALKIQKELDKEMRTINRTRGTPDEYLLRTKKLPPSCEKKVFAKNKTALTTAKSLRTSGSSERSQSSTLELCNKQAMLKSNLSNTCRQKSRILQDPTTPLNNQKERCQNPLSSMDANSAAFLPVSELRNGKKQQTIVDMFQKHNTKQ